MMYVISLLTYLRRSLRC